MDRDIRETDLSEPLSVNQLRAFKTIRAAIAYPGQRAGFAAVAALADNDEIYLLDEAESFDIQELIRQCGQLDTRWEPENWFADTRNGAAEELIYEWNEKAGRGLQPVMPYLLDTDNQGSEIRPLYAYIVPVLRRLLDKSRRRLFLKNSMAVNYLDEIRPGEIAGLERGEFPAVEALGFVVTELLQEARSGVCHLPERTGDADGYDKAFRSLAVSGAYDDLDADDEDDEDWYQTE